MSSLVSLMIEKVQRLLECRVSSAILGVDVGSTRVSRELLASEHNHSPSVGLIARDIIDSRF